MVRSHSVSGAAQIAHWLGCLLGSGLVLLFVAFAFGGHEDPPPANPATIALGVMLFGYLLAWWSDWLGGFVSLAAFAGFYMWSYFNSGVLIGGPIFPLCFAPGALCLLAARLRSRSQHYS